MSMSMNGRGSMIAFSRSFPGVAAARAIRRAVAAAVCLLTVGCAVGPNFHRPEVHAPQAWLGAKAETTATTAPSMLIASTTPTAAIAPTSETAETALAKWWRAFNDPVLSSLVERGVQSNLDVQLAVQRIEQARAVLGETAAGLWPSLDLSGSYQRSHTRLPVPKPKPLNFQRSFFTNAYRAGLDAVWNLDLFGGVRRGVEASRADARAAEEDLRNALVTLTAEIGTNYLSLRGLQEQLRITRENLEIQTHSMEITRQRVEVGFANGLDLANAEAQVATTRAQIPGLEAAIRQAIYGLSLLLGEEPQTLVQELETVRPIPSSPMRIPTGLPSDLLRRRPDIRRAEEQLHAATARIGVALADLFPSFSLSGSQSLQSNRLASWKRSVTSTWAFSPSVQWNFFDGWLRWYRVKENRAVAEQALTQYRQTVLTAFEEVEGAWIAFDREIARSRALEIAVERNRHALDLARQLYIEGQTDFLSVLVAEQSLYSTQNALVQSKAATGGDLVALYKALGGGWDQGSS
jgi:NodT family efflux transporter outer membrane factor (OMF) lipoprotein